MRATRQTATTICSFLLFDTPAVGTGTQQGVTITNPTVQVATGAFSVPLDFGPDVFDGSARYIEIGVRPAGSGNPYTTLSPRQPISSSPYAIRSLAATAADGLSVACVNCVTSSQLQGVEGTQISGEIPVASIPAGSTNYVQNTSKEQADSNFNISGNGVVGGDLTVLGTLNATFVGSFINNGLKQQPDSNFNISGNGVAGGTLSANVFDSATLYNIAGNPVMSLGTGVDNLFVGPFAGQADPTGGANSFFGVSAGFNTTTGAANSFFGRSAGFQNTTGGDNSFFGVQAGRDNSTGTLNSFFGRAAGIGNSSGFDNSYFGAFAGQAASTGSANSFFGVSAGFNNTGTANSFFGRSAGFQNTTGGSNSFFGVQAGRDNSTGSFNSFFGRSAGQANSTGAFNAFFGHGAGLVNTTGSNNTFLGASTGFANTTGNTNVFIGDTAGFINTTGSSNTFVGDLAGGANTTGSKNSFFGERAGNFSSTGTENTLIGARAELGAGDLTNATAIGANALVSQSNSLILGDNANVGIGTSSPAAKLQVEGGNQTGIFARADSSRFAIFADGNAGQSRDKGGWVKAMLLVTYTGAGATIVRCYDSSTNTSTPPCVTLVNRSPGFVTVIFPFQVDDRFISLTPLNGEGILTIGGSSVTVSAGFSPGSFFIFVY